jgi:ADP-ribose pyrophosphatase
MKSKFSVESGELSITVEDVGHEEAAKQALKIWQAAEERLCLGGLLTVKGKPKKLGERIFSTATVLAELGINFFKNAEDLMTMPPAKPKITKTEDIATEKWLALKRLHYKWPGGKNMVWDFVTRPTRKGKHDAVVVVPFLKNPNRLVVTREFRLPINDFEIGFCAGLIDGTETPEQAARRELKEETGLELKKVLSVSPPLFSSPGMTNENVVMVFCEAEGQLVGVDSDEEHIEAFVLDLKGVEEVLRKPPCSMSQKLWPVLCMMKQQGFIGWKA